MSTRTDKLCDAVEQLSRVFQAHGIAFRTVEGQLAFILNGCGCSTAAFRLFQDGFVVVLIGEFGFHAEADRRGAVCEFVNWANYTLLPTGNLEMNPENGHVQYREALILPIESPITDAQLQWFVTSAAECVAVLSYPLAHVISTSIDVMAAVQRAKELLSPAANEQKHWA